MRTFASFVFVALGVGGLILAQHGQTAPDSAKEAVPAQQSDNSDTDVDTAQAARDQHRAQRDQGEAERDQAQAERDQSQAERDQYQAELDRAETEREQGQTKREQKLAAPGPLATGGKKPGTQGK